MEVFRIVAGLGARVRAQRESLAMTQTALADATGVTPRTILKYESDETPFTVEWLARFAEVGADLDLVLYGRKHKRSADEKEYERALARAFSWADEFCRDPKGRPAPASVRLEHTLLAYRLLIGSKGLDTDVPAAELTKILRGSRSK